MKLSKSIFQSIPGVGPSISKDLEELGFSTIEELDGADPEKLFSDLQELRGKRIDKCVLYVFREAVYYASNKEHDPEKLKWWNWKERTL
ncbi:MAG: Pathogenicity locus [Synergistales bacterium]|nr:Pathogenicity locus [Synergistales bacterium]